jgi:hypothetical protein
MATFDIKRNDRLPQLRATLLDSTGAAINLTGMTVTFKMRPRDGGALKVNQAGAVVSAGAGTVSYTWQAGDTDTPGIYDAEWVLTSVSGDQTVPTAGYLVVTVLPNLS